MKKSKLILIIIISVVAGLITGYFLFSIFSNDKSEAADIVISSEETEEIWTCSMHPQIRQNEPGACPICGMDLIPLSAEVNEDPLVLQMTAESVQLANIQTTTVGNATSESGNILRLSGKIKANEQLASSLVAHIPGRIEKLFVSYTGEQVYKGQKIASIYSPELITAQRSLIESVRLQDINPDLLEAARTKLRYLKIPEETISKIESGGEIQETFEIYADHSGVVTQKKVNQGDYVGRGEVLFDVVNLSRVWAVFDAYEDDLSEINIGDKIEFTTPSLPGRSFTTSVSFIDPVIDPQTRVASVRTELHNPGGVLKPEMFISGRLATGPSDENLAIPKSAVLWTGERSVVYVKVPGTEIPSFRFTEVKLGESTKNKFIVLEGLEPTDEIVTYGAFVIDAAAQLNNQASMMNRNVVLKSGQKYEVIPDFKDISPPAFKDQLGEVVSQYLKIKNALVASDSLEVKEFANQMLSATHKVDMQLLKGDAHMYWMEKLNAIMAHGKNMAKADDIKEQRNQFEFLSEALINAVRAFGVDEKLYVQHCPMVNNNIGADWLSGEEEIRNPYFGDKMLKCGSVKTIIE